MAKASNISKKESIILWIAATAVAGLSLAGVPLRFYPLVAIGIVGDAAFLL